MFIPPKCRCQSFMASYCIIICKTSVNQNDGGGMGRGGDAGLIIIV
jgi:hypothetical protein